MHLQIDLDNTMLAHYTTHLKLLERGKEKEKEKEKFRGFFQIFLRRHAKMKRHTNHSVPKNNSMKFIKKASRLQFIFLFVLFVALLEK